MLFEQFLKHRGKCPICGTEMIITFDNEVHNVLGNVATFDHAVPLFDTMEHDKENLQLMCKDCNNEKANKKEVIQNDITR